MLFLIEYLRIKTFFSASSKSIMLYLSILLPWKRIYRLNGFINCYLDRELSHWQSYHIFLYLFTSNKNNNDLCHWLLCKKVQKQNIIYGRNTNWIIHFYKKKKKHLTLIVNCVFFILASSMLWGLWRHRNFTERVFNTIAARICWPVSSALSNTV